MPDPLQRAGAPGIIYYIEGKRPDSSWEKVLPARLCPSFRKGPARIQGIYQFMYNNFAQSISDNFPFINMEQDLGNEALRQAKSSYRPDKMLIKYRVSPKS